MVFQNDYLAYVATFDIMKIRTVAVVSGSGESIELLEEHIRKLSPSVQIVKIIDGSTAHENISEQRPDLIVVDTLSPGMDGFAVCAKLKSDERTGIIPLICFYSPDERENRIKALKYGADGLLPWPPENEELKAMVASLTKNPERHNKQLAHPESTIWESERLHALLESEQKYRSLFENSVDAILLTSPDGGITAANPSACRMFGRTEEEIIKLGRSGLIDDTDPRVKGLLAERDRTGRTEGELNFLRKDGTRVHAEVTSVIYSDIGGAKKSSIILRDITRRKQLEDEVREREEKLREQDLQFRKLSAHVHDLIYQFTRKTDGTYVVPVASAGIKNIFGCSPEDVLNDFGPIARVIHPEDIERVTNDIENSARNLTNFTCEFRVQRPGHPMQWIFSRSTPEKLPDGSVTWYGFNADITYRRQVEEALRESESKFRKIYEEGPYGVALINSEQRFMMANSTICQMLGCDESELLNMTFFEIIHPDDRASVAENHRKLITRESDVVRSEKRYLRKDGSVIWASVTVTSNYDDSGAFAYYLAIAEDITDRRLASVKVAVLNERLSLMVEAIQELSTAATLKSIMKIVMDTARRLLNADGATFVLREGDKCYYADENAVSPLWKGQRCRLEKCVSGWAMLNRQAVIIEDVYSDDLVHHENYRSTFVRSLAIAPIRLNNPLGAIGAYWSTTFAPSTAELQLLQTLADAAAKAVENIQLIEGLERTISDRTSDLRAVNRELEAFSYSVSHDLRAPLRHINGFAEVLINKHSDQLNEEALRFLNTITSSARKMGTLIDDLLKLSRTSRSELNKSFNSMNKILDDVLLQLEPVIKDRTIDWKIESMPQCFCDQNLMSLVWTNLIENAVKYTRKKAKAVIIIGHRKEESETVFYIRDNGIGFDMKYAQKLFGAFQRMHSSKEYEGSGVGLANVQRIILRHGGITWAESVPDEGTTIFFSLPDPAESYIPGNIDNH